MDDYISRADFRQTLINTPFHPRCQTMPDLLTAVQDRLNDTLELLDDFPAADVRPVVHGHWKDACTAGIEETICSECWYSGFHHLNFCPNCGADMTERKKVNE